MVDFFFVGIFWQQKNIREGFTLEFDDLWFSKCEIETVSVLSYLRIVQHELIANHNGCIIIISKHNPIKLIINHLTPSDQSVGTLGDEGDGPEYEFDFTAK